MKKLVFIISICFAIQFTHAQEDNCIFLYTHMDGLVGNDKAIVDLLISNNEIKGSCTFPELREKDGPMEGLIRTQRLEGSIDEHGVASLKAYSQNIEIGEYSGMLEQDYKGTYRENNSGITRSFTFMEEASSNSIPLKGYCIDRDSNLVDTADSPHAHIQMYILLPEKSDSMQVLREAIFKAIFGQQIRDTVPDASLLNTYSDNYFRRYLEANIDIYDGGHSFSWEMYASSYVNINSDGLLVYKADNYGYTGGAHGMGVSRFLVFDTQEMKQLSLRDIFETGYENELSKLLERKYRNEYYLGEEQSLKEAGLFENTIPPSDNFYLTHNSIGFYYNPYQLAPYSMGSVSINLRFDEVLSLIKIDSPVMRLVK